MVRSAIGASVNNTSTEAAKGVDFGYFNALGKSRWRQQFGASLGEQCFASAGWPSEQNIVSTGDGDSKCALGIGLAKNIVKGYAIMLIFLSIFDRNRSALDCCVSLQK